MTEDDSVAPPRALTTCSSGKLLEFGEVPIVMGAVDIVYPNELKSTCLPVGLLEKMFKDLVRNALRPYHDHSTVQNSVLEVVLGG